MDPEQSELVSNLRGLLEAGSHSTPLATPMPARMHEFEAEMLARERDLIARERELLARERELLSQTSRAQTSSIPSSSWLHAEDHVLPEFDPAKTNKLTADQWIEKLESLATLYDWDEKALLFFATSKLRGAARFWYDSTTDTVTTWGDFSCELRRSFPSNFDQADIHIQLTRRMKKADESYESYVYEMAAIGKKGRIDTSSIIKYIIAGITDRDLARSLAFCEVEGVQQLLGRIKTYEALSEQTKMKHDFQTPKFKKEQSTGPRPVSTTIRCYNCGAKGHRSSECKDINKGKKCFSCKNFGHIASNCPNQRNALCNYPTHGISRVCKLIKIAGTETEALLDTGCDLNLIRHKTYTRLNCGHQAIVTRLYGVGHNPVDSIGRFETILEIDGESYDVTFHIVQDKDIPTNAILGQEFFKVAELSLTADGCRTKRMKEVVKPLEVLDGSYTDCADGTKHEDINPEVDYFHELPFALIANNEKIELDIMSKKYAENIEELCREYDPSKISKYTKVKLNIILADEEPVCQRARRLSWQEKNEVDKQIEAWLEDGTISPSTSNYSSPVVLTSKKDGSKRLCVDYRALNKKTVRDRYPLPIIEDQLDRLRGAKVFSTIDLRNGFHHVPVDPQSRKYTAFVTHRGLYEFNKTPFGLTNAPAVFQRFINNVFQDLVAEGIVLLYLDDVIIPAKDEEEGYARLKIVLRRAEQFGLMINWKKCQFLATRIEYLGYLIEDNKIEPSQNKVDAVINFPKPTNTKMIQSFLGLTGYFRKFIQDYSILAKPLSDLLKKDAKFQFEDKQEQAFNNLKHKLAMKPVLEIYDPEAATELHCDASKFGYGAVLLQKSKDDNEYHPIYFMSRKTTTAEEKYSSYELEVLAVVNALKKFRIYLLGLNFKIFTDCAAFQMTLNKKEVVPRIARWVLYLEEYDYKIEHRAGSQMKHADALSRNPVLVITRRNEFLHQVKTVQREDQHIKTIMKILEDNKEYDDYYLEYDILYKRYEERGLLVIPTKMESQIIRQCHEDNGHFSVKKTEEVLCREYWIPELRQKIQTLIKNCIPCILAERKRGKQEGFLNPIDKGDLPLHTYHLDHLGPLGPTNKGYRYLFTVVDAFTKFIWIYPTKSTTSKEVISRLESQKIIFGNPKRMVTDRGTAFTSGEFRKYCEEQNIEHFQITTGVPRGNGQVERFNSIIIPVLTKLSLNDEKGWYKHVNQLQTILNDSYQRSIDMTPFELMLGVKMSRPENVRMREIIDAEYSRTFNQEREDRRNRAKKQIQKIQEENKRSFNKKRKKAQKYKIDDLVAIQRTQFTTQGKLRPKFLGPYKVVKVKPKDRYDVERVGPGESPRLTSTAADFMKPWATNFDITVSDFSVPSTEGSTDCRHGRAVGLPHTYAHGQSREVTDGSAPSGRE